MDLDELLRKANEIVAGATTPPDPSDTLIATTHVVLPPPEEITGAYVRALLDDMPTAALPLVAWLLNTARVVAEAGPVFDRAEVEHGYGTAASWRWAVFLGAMTTTSLPGWMDTSERLLALQGALLAGITLVFTDRIGAKEG